MNDLLEVLLKIGLTVLISGLIGLEREVRHKVADLRTHILVGVGSMLIVLTSQYLFDIYIDRVHIDPTRMIAGIITGIGFLCAGCIIKAGDHVRGLTTAATVWIVSCLGIAIGAGQYLTASIVAVVVFLVLICVRKFENLIMKKFPSED